MESTNPCADLSSSDGDMCADMSRSRSPAAAAAACVEYTYPRADLAVRDGDIRVDMSRTRSPAAVAAACVGTTSPHAGLAVCDGGMDAISACSMGTCSGPCRTSVTSGCERARAAFVACMDHGPLLHVLA